MKTKQSMEIQVVSLVILEISRQLGCPIHPICNGSSKGLTTRHGSPDRQYCTIRHGSLRPVLRKVDPSTGSHYARQLNGSGFYRRKWTCQDTVHPEYFGGSWRSDSGRHDPSQRNRSVAVREWLQLRNLFCCRTTKRYTAANSIIKRKRVKYICIHLVLKECSRKHSFWCTIKRSCRTTTHETNNLNA